MTEHDALLTAVLAAPGDDLPRLVLADHLDEHGSPARAEFIRVQVEMSRLRCDFTAVRADTCFDRRADPEDVFRTGCARCREAIPLALREGRLLASGAADDGRPTPVARVCNRFRYRRGFVSSIGLTQDAYCEFAGDLFRRHPITRVQLWHKTPYMGDRLDRWYWDDANGADVFALPDALFARLGGELVGSAGRYSRGFASQQQAESALSAACVAYGRKQAGLPHLEPEPAT